MKWSGDSLRLVGASVRLVAGRWFWLYPLLPLIWIAFQLLRLLLRWRPDEFGPVDAQNLLIGFPLSILAVLFGVRVIAGEIDRRTLEIAYTVPGGTHRVWLAKIVASALLLAASEALLAIVTAVFCTNVPWIALYGAYQAALFYLVLSMALSALLKSEAAGAMLVGLVMVLNGPFQGGNVRFSPFWNHERALAAPGADAVEVLGWAIQNRIGFLLAIGAITALAFSRAESREKLLGG